MNKDFPRSVNDWPFASLKDSNHSISFSPTGIFSVSWGRVVTFFRQIHNKIEPIGSITPFDCNVSHISWCNAINEVGRTPFYILIAGESNRSIIYDLVSQKGIYGISSKTPVTKCCWVTGSFVGLCAATSNQQIAYIQFIDKQPCTIWERFFDFNIDFMCLSLGKELLIASKTGIFMIIDLNISNESKESMKQIPLHGEELISISYFRFIPETALIVTSKHVFMFNLKENTIICIYQVDPKHENINNVYFSHDNESHFLVLFGTFARSFKMTEERIFKTEDIVFLSHPQTGINSILSSAQFKNKIVVLTRGGFLQLINMKNDHISISSIYRWILEKPVDLDVQGNKILIGTNSGKLVVSHQREIYKIFNLCEGKIQKVLWLGENKLVALTSCGKSQQAYYVDLTLMKIKSLLNKSLEVLSTKKIKVHVSLSKVYYAIVVAKSVILIFQDDEHIVTIFEPRPVILSFSDTKDTEIWTISTKWLGKKYTISPSHYTVTRMTTFDLPQTYYPVVASSFNDHMILGASNGDVIAIDWYGSKPIAIHCCKNSITNLYPCDLQCFVKDSKHNCVIIDDKWNFKDFPRQLKLVKWTGSNNIIAQFAKERSFSFISIHESVRFDVMETTDLQITPEQLIEQRNSNARKKGFLLLAELLSNEKKNVFNRFSTILNYDKDRAMKFVITLSYLFKRSHHSQLRSIKLRVFLILGKYDDALSLMLSASPESPSFAFDIIKTTFLNQGSESVKSIMPMLIEGNKINEAIDLLFLTNQYENAASLLVQEGSIEMALIVCKLKLNEEESARTIDQIIEYYIKNGKFIHAASFMIGTNKKDKVIEFLNANGYDYITKLL